MNCRQKKSIYAAPIAALANQKKYDLSEYRGVDGNQIHLADERVIYADEDDKVRELDLESGRSRAITEEAFGRSGNSFIATDKKLVVSSAEKYGTRYEMLVADFGETPRVVPGSGIRSKVQVEHLAGPAVRPLRWTAPSLLPGLLVVASVSESICKC